MLPENATQAPHSTPPSRLLRRREVLNLTGLANSTLYLYMAQGRFPKPRKIGARSVAWPQEAVADWIASRPVAELRQEEAVK